MYNNWENLGKNNKIIENFENFGENLTKIMVKCIVYKILENKSRAYSKQILEKS